MGNIAALFDIDGTIYRHSLMIEHFNRLVKYEIIDSLAWHSHLKYTFQDWDKRQGNYDDYIEEISEVYKKNVKGLNNEKIDFIAQQVISLTGDKVYRYTRRRIEWHKSQGHKVFFISGSPDYLVSKMAKKFDITDFRGTKYLADGKGHLTGDVVPMWDAVSKKRAIKELVNQYDIDLDQSYSYGDTHGDLTMLQMVGNPIAFNPSKELFKKIQEDENLLKKALIIVERKDIIYELNAGTKIL